MSRDPIRLSDPRDPTSADGEFLSTVLRSARRASPPPGKMDELAGRLGPVLGNKPPSPVRWLPWASAAVVAVAVVTTTMVVTRSNSGPTAASATTNTVVTAEQPEPTAEAKPLADAPPAISVDSLPDARTLPAAAAMPSASASAARCNEVELIDSADTKLRAGDATGALAATREHEQRCGSGVLVQERERIAIEALAKLGRADAARARARSFEERFPSSPHVRRVRQVIDESNR